MTILEELTKYTNKYPINCTFQVNGDLLLRIKYYVEMLEGKVIGEGMNLPKEI